MYQKFCLLVFISTAAGLMPATSIGATTVYKCANSYSQTPCPEGQAITLNDGRSEAQKQQAQAASRQDAKLANTLEKDRLSQERLLTKEQTAAKSKPSNSNTSKADAPKQTQATVITPKRVKPPGYKPAQFVAEVPGTRKPVKPK